MADIIRPGQLTRQPQFIAPVNSSWALFDDLCFLANGFVGPYDFIGKKAATTWNKSRVATPRGMSLSNTAAAAKTAEFDYSPVIGSNGNGTGGVTFAILANPPAEARESCLIGLIMNGSPYKQLALYANMNGDTGGQTSGMLSIEAYNNGNQGFGNAASVIDGGWHVYVGVFNHGAHSVYVDGENKTTANGISPGSPGDGTFGLDASSRISVGNESYNSSSRVINCQIPFAAAWNRALTQPEIALLTKMVWSAWSGRVRRIWYSVAAAGGFKPAWARNSNVIIGARA